ncbi:unnamed protein product [Musa acuminata subsp. malaccensis]|uniref:(wild Malaysian banana) hypothetical protein n=1 Tax=Musa acuminata subsp. malaccensis TaxID=214687 RepID=A0A804JUZ0_MUSAM|nr:unnamed protein product [Musa acuminata subsp. malaccensis]
MAMSPIKYLTRLLVAITSLSLLASFTDAHEDRQVYIAYMGNQPSSQYYSTDSHLTLLDRVLDGGSSAKERLVYSYTRSFNGLAARLTHEEKEKLAGEHGVISVFPSRKLKPHTTRSWDFLGLTRDLQRKQSTGTDIIVGMLDTGIWPEAEAFSDEGFGPPPSKWKGVCQNFTCNNKIVGARFYIAPDASIPVERSPRDFNGHGSHTASTVAGGEVRKASLYGIAKGTARGGAPTARIAVYKICWSDGCDSHHILAAFDDAIADGVDIISVSLGGSLAVDYFEDELAIGSFHAVAKGILTSASAGNYGPYRETVTNVAPWMLVVAASSIDRRIVDKVVLGNNKTISGISINSFPSQKKFYPLVLGDESICLEETPNTTFEGKIILCDGLYEAGAVSSGAKGALAVISDLDSARTYSLPAVGISERQGKTIRNYIERASRRPLSRIKKSRAIFNPGAPVVAFFSSRGPNPITPNILKPDISAPGTDILATWSPKGSVSNDVNDTRSVKYNIISGTSMACPHATAVAAYVKSFHPGWSPAAIKSALMTTATPMSPSRNPEAELAYGAGQLNPKKATSPGLVYDATARDFVNMLCVQGYSTRLIRLVTGDNSSSCPRNVNVTTVDMNYPTMTRYVARGKEYRAEFSRTVTNVGNPNSTYTAKVASGSGLDIEVNPRKLHFGELNEKQSFVVRVAGKPLSLNSVASASIVWSDGKHEVRSPIVIHTEHELWS